MVMRLVVLASAREAAARAARHAAGALSEAIAARGGATLALSGGSSATPLCAALTGEPLNWAHVDVFQVDERVAPGDDAARNLLAIERGFGGAGPVHARVHTMPVERGDLAAAAATYEAELCQVAGNPPALDVVHLGLGADGHTASLFAGDPATGISDRSVAVTAVHAGYRRMTLTLPVLNGAGLVVWLVTGAGKAAALDDLVSGRLATPAGRVARQRAVVFADEAAAQTRADPAVPVG
jgi:6-phosphogluconolactonase